jgi:glycosyltransferase involved in cell wall biosynthesis
MKSTAYFYLERIASAWTDKIICVSQSEHDAALRDRVASEDKLIVIKNGINVNDFRNRRQGVLREAINAGPHTKIIGMVSRLSRPKRPEDLINAARYLATRKEVSSFACVFIGGGPLEYAMQELVHQKGLGHIFHFLGEREDIPDLLADLDIFVLASASEGLPYTLLEAMSVGVPVIGSKVKGIIDLIQDGTTGYLYNLGDSFSLSQVIKRLLQDKGLRSTLGGRGQELVMQEYNLQSMIENTATLYRSLANRQPSK